MEEVLKGKFCETIRTIEGYLKEAEGDRSVNGSFNASAVESRIKDIKNAFEQDLVALIADLKLDENSPS